MLTRENAIENHRKMWRRIAEKTREEKRRVDEYEVVKELWRDTYIHHDCWCCEYVNQFGDDCNYCPVKWENDCNCEDSEYDEWMKAFFDCDWEEAAKWADVIAELPEREGA